MKNMLAAILVLALLPLPTAAQESVAADGQREAPLAVQTDTWAGHALSDAEAARQGRAALPFTRAQIEALGRLLRETQEAAARGAGTPPRGRIRRVRLDASGVVEPGRSPARASPVPEIALRRGYVTVVSFTDMTGAPWPIEEALVDRRFLPPGGDEGRGTDDQGSGSGLVASHLLYLAPAEAYLAGNAAVKLAGLAEPVSVSLRGTGADADFRVEIRLGLAGPNADPGALAQAPGFHAGDATLLGLLGGEVPPDAERLVVGGGDAADRAWRRGGDLLLLTRAHLLSPGPLAAERGPGGRWAYRLPDTPLVLVSAGGLARRLALAGTANGTEWPETHVPETRVARRHSCRGLPMRTEPSRRTARRRAALPACGVVLPALLAWWLLAGPALGQVPDNRAPKLDPEDSLPPFYEGTLEERDRQRLDAARAAGETFIPVIPGPGTAPGAGHEAVAEAADTAPVPPQTGLRGLPAAGAPGARRVRPSGPFRRRPRGCADRELDTGARDRAAAQSGGGRPGPDPASPGGVPEHLAGQDRQTAESILPRIAAGRGFYARTLYAVDSDYPGPVLLELLEPPLAGAVASGGFSLAGERLVLRLDRLEYRGRSEPVDAWAVDPGCACYGVDGEVDSHWFSRVLLPSAVRFAEGFLGALSRPNETVIVHGGDLRYERLEASSRDAVHAGLATAARSAGDVLLENAPEGPTVRIPRDTELVVVFAAPPGGASGQAGGRR